MTNSLSAGQALADRIAQSLRATDPVPGTLIGSETALRDEYDASRSVFHQAMRILEHRGMVQLRRGQGGGIVFTGKEDQSTARDLARLIESQTTNPDDIWALLRAADLQLYLWEAPRLTLEACIRVRELIASLEAMSQATFAAELGHRKLQSMLRNILQDDLVILAQRVVLEAGIDMFPARWHIAGESLRRDFWVLSLRLAESMIANDIAGMVTARNGQIEMLKGAFQTARLQQDFGSLRRVGHPNDNVAGRAGDVVVGNRADFLVREILDEIRCRHWTVGERLGTAPELMERYGVSLPVLRQAIRVLEECGAIQVSRGRGGGLEIGAPSRSTTYARAVDFVRHANAKGCESQQLLIGLLLTALDQLHVRAGPAEMAALRVAIEAAGPRFSLNEPSSQALCLAIVGLSRNAALTTFVRLILDAAEPTCAARRAAADTPDVLKKLLEAVENHDSGLARRALLHHISSPRTGRPQ